MAEEKAQKNESGKVKKAFEANMRKMVGLLRGEVMFKTPKAAPAELKEAIEVLVKEEKEALTKKIVEEARKLIHEKREFDKFVNQQRKEMDKKVEAKQKEFNEKSKVLFGMVSDVGQLEKDYYETMKNTATGTPNADPEPDDDDDNDTEKS